MVVDSPFGIANGTANGRLTKGGVANAQDPRLCRRAAQIQADAVEVGIGGADVLVELILDSRCCTSCVSQRLLPLISGFYPRKATLVSCNRSRWRRSAPACRGDIIWPTVPQGGMGFGRGPLPLPLPPPGLRPRAFGLRAGGGGETKGGGGHSSQGSRPREGVKKSEGRSVAVLSERRCI
jgi:hypothetical protein